MITAPGAASFGNCLSWNTVAAASRRSISTALTLLKFVSTIGKIARQPFLSVGDLLQRQIMGLAIAWLPEGAALQSIDHFQTVAIYLQSPWYSFKQNFDKNKAIRTGSTGGAATLKHEFPGATSECTCRASNTLQATLQDLAHCPSRLPCFQNANG